MVSKYNRLMPSWRKSKVLPYIFFCLLVAYLVIYRRREIVQPLLTYSASNNTDMVHRVGITTSNSSNHHVTQPSTPSSFTTKKITNVTTKIQIKKRASICVFFTGGLGNQMFIYAAAFGIARQKNMSLFIDAKSAISNVFKNISCDKRTNMDECRKVPFAADGGRHCAFSENFLKLNASKSHRVGLYLQSWKYFQQVDNDIKKEFIFNNDIQNKANFYLSKHLKKYGVDDRSKVTLVGVHVRRGDIVHTKQFLDYGYQVPGKDYFLEAFQVMKRAFRNVTFIVSSNDIPWVKTNIIVENVTVIEDRNSAEVDMAVLTKCDHTIMSVGSFGWWIGYLTGGLTVYYRHPAKNGSGLRSTFSSDMKDYFYPGWVGLE